MRVLDEQQHPHVKITYYHWNNKFIVKFERGMLEQTFKVSEFDVTDEKELKSLITEEFIQKVVKRFEDMSDDLSSIITY